MKLKMVEVLFAEASAYTMQSKGKVIKWMWLVRLDRVCIASASAQRCRANKWRRTTYTRCASVWNDAKEKLLFGKLISIPSSTFELACMVNVGEGSVGIGQNGGEMCLDASPRTYYTNVLGQMREKRYNRKVDGDNKYVNALSSVAMY